MTDAPKTTTLVVAKLTAAKTDSWRLEYADGYPCGAQWQFHGWQAEAMAKVFEELINRAHADLEERKALAKELADKKKQLANLEEAARQKADFDKRVNEEVERRISQQAAQREEAPKTGAPYGGLTGEQLIA